MTETRLDIMVGDERLEVLHHEDTGTNCRMEVTYRTARGLQSRKGAKAALITSSGYLVHELTITDVRTAPGFDMAPDAKGGGEVIATTTRDAPFWVAEPGRRVKVQTKKGVATGTIQGVDNTTFPGKVFVKIDGDGICEVPIGLGWPD